MADQLMNDDDDDDAGDTLLSKSSDVFPWGGFHQFFHCDCPRFARVDSFFFLLARTYFPLEEDVRL